MNRFSYARAATWAEAQALLADRRFSLPVLKAGGLDVLDQMKEGLLEPDLLIDVRSADAHLDAPRGADENADHSDPQQSSVAEASRGGREVLDIRPSATLAALASHPLVNQKAPALAQAAESAATPQVRAVATAAGNLLQRPRCWYFRNDEFACLKKGGATCFAVEGENRYHAIFGGGPCHIVHPSNLACAIHALGGSVQGLGLESPIAIEDLYHTPDRGIRTEHTLPDKSVITGISAFQAPISGFYAIKEKQSFDWPAVMAAVALTVQNSRIASARVCAGAVAPVPWALPRVAEALTGLATDDDAAIANACSLASAGATPMSGNAYKLRLLPVAVTRAVLRALGRLPEELL